MRTTIFYFTSTGNSLAAARRFAEKLGNTELVSIPCAAGAEPDCSSDRIGFVFPVYMWGLPNIVREFITACSFNESQYTFAIATCGGFAGGTLVQAGNLIRKRGGTLCAGFGVKMVGNYTPLYGAPPEERQSYLLSKAKEKLNKALSCVKEENRGTVEKGFFLTRWLLSGFVYRMGIKRIRKEDRNFSAEDSCTSCGICSDVCPVNNIEMVEGKPVWQHRCEHCMGCLQWCPEQAIQFKSKTKGRRRYHHPDVTMQDIKQSSKSAV